MRKPCPASSHNKPCRHGFRRGTARRAAPWAPRGLPAVGPGLRLRTKACLRVPSPGPRRRSDRHRGPRLPGSTAHRRGDPGPRGTWQTLPPHRARDPDREVPGPAGGDVRQPRAVHDRGRPGLRLPMGRPALAQAPPRSFRWDGGAAPRRVRGLRRARPRKQDRATGGRNPHPTADGCGPSRFHARSGTRGRGRHDRPGSPGAHEPPGPAANRFRVASQDLSGITCVAQAHLNGNGVMAHTRAVHRVA